MSSKLSKISLTRAAYIVVTNTMGYTIEQKIGRKMLLQERLSHQEKALPQGHVVIMEMFIF